MKNIQNAVVSAVELVVDDRIKKAGIPNHVIGTIERVDGKEAVVHTPLGDFSARIPNQFSGVEVGAVVICVDLYGTGNHRYVDSILSGSFVGGGSGGGGGTTGGFRVRDYATGAVVGRI